MNIGGSFFRSFPTAGALSRTVLQDLTGGKTQVREEESNVHFFPYCTLVTCNSSFLVCEYYCFIPCTICHVGYWFLV